MIYIFLFIIGLFIGSFLNMLIDRLPHGEQIVKGRSKCDSCKHVLSWKDLIPVASWVWLKGRCRYCHKPVPVRNTIVELVTGGMFILTAISMGQWVNESIGKCLSISMTHCATDSLTLFLSLVIVASLIAIFFIDLKYYIIPDSLNVVIGICAILLWFTKPYPLSPMNYIFSALGAFAFFLLLHLGSIFFLKKDGMGLGDVKFSFVMGLVLGYPDIIVSLYIAFLTGAIVSVILILRGKKRFGQGVPFGPFLVFGTLIMMLNLIPQEVLMWVFPYLYW